MKHTSSISSKLMIYIGITVVSLSLALILVFAKMVTHHYKADREHLLSLVASSYISLIDRPLSQGNYIQVQTDLHGKQPLPFIKSVTTFNSSGKSVATTENNTNTCSQKASFHSLIYGTVKDQAIGKLTIVSSECDIQARIDTLYLVSLFAIILISIITFFILKYTIRFALRPLSYVIKKSSNAKSLTNDLVLAAPAEIRPLIGMLGNQYTHFLKGEVADDVAHNIASPLMGLGQTLDRYRDTIPSEPHNLMTSFYNKIKSITDNLNFSTISKPSDGGRIFLDLLVRNVVRDKTEEYFSGKDVTVVLDDHASDFGLFVNFDPEVLDVVLFNLIHNAYQAIQSKGTITLTIKTNTQNEHQVLIQDDGPGIPNHVIKKIFNKHFSHGKRGGRGRGLTWAKTELEKRGASIDIQSTEGNGTLQAVTIPSALPPKWFIRELDLSKISKLVVVDDESDIIEVWKKKLCNSKIQVVHYDSREALSTYIDKCSDLSEVLFAVDFQFSRKDYSGIDIILGHSLKNAVLVTNRLNDSSVFKRCEEHGIKLLPKSLINEVSVFFAVDPPSNLPLYYLEDEKYLRLSTTQSLQKYGFKVHPFSSSHDLIEHLPQIPEDSLFLFDNDLGKMEQNGLEVAELLVSRGFKKPFLLMGNHEAYTRNVFLRNKHVLSGAFSKQTWTIEAIAHRLTASS